jgi:hypothetical protein
VASTKAAIRGGRATGPLVDEPGLDMWIEGHCELTTLEEPIARKAWRAPRAKAS